MAAAISSACTKEDVKAVPEEPAADSRVEMTFTASLEGGADTKTQLGAEADGKMPVLWQATDKLGVWDGTELNEFSIPSSVTDFTGPVDFTGIAEEGQDMYYAVYPYSADYEFVAEEGKTPYFTGVKIPAEQIATKGSYDPAAAASVACAADKAFYMKNAISLAKITLKTSDIKSVTITASDADSDGKAYLAATCKVVVQDAPATYAQVDQSHSVTLKSSSESLAIEPGEYYIAMIPRTLASGVTVTYTNMEGQTAVKSTTKEVKFERASILPLNIDDSKLTFVAPEEPEPEPETLTLTVDFANQPFNANIPSSATVTGETGDTYTLSQDGKDYEFTIINTQNGYRYASSSDVYFLELNRSTAGDGHIELPAVENMKLISVDVTTTNNKKFSIGTATDAETQAAGVTINATTKTLTLSAPEVNTNYYLWTTASNSRIAKLVLTYTE